MSRCQSLLHEGLAEVRQRVREASNLSLFLDFDGTLTPIVEDPQEARLEARTRRVLKALANHPNVLLVIVSGRSLADLRARVGIDHVVYAGNHGLEIAGRGLHFVEPFAASRRQLLSLISQRLAERLSGISGVRLESKGLTTSVHYRGASSTKVPEIQQIVTAGVANGVTPFYLNEGKMVLEILPRSSWDKGAAACWINSRLAPRGVVSICVGDDQTDETAFRQLPDQITVRVGKPAGTSARFHVPDAAAVHEFLSWLTKNLRRSGSACGGFDDGSES